MARSTAGISPPSVETEVMRFPGSLTLSLSESPTLGPSGSLPTTFGPRVGQITLHRGYANSVTVGGSESDFSTTNDSFTETAARTCPIKRITVDTPNIFVGTSRGVVPHLSRDHVNGSDAIRWINVPFESFLEQVPPIPTLQHGTFPLHRFLGFDEDRQIVSLCLRNPLDTREMPPNGDAHVSANCVRGVKKVTLTDWRKYVYKTQPDVVFALTDAPFTPPPYSQKRITKSIERSMAWVADMLRPLPLAGEAAFTSGSGPTPHAPQLSHHPLNVFVHMAGGTSLAAREAFAYGLRETLHGPEADSVRPLRSLDEGIAGYAFDLAVLRGRKPSPNTSRHQSLPDDFLQLESPEMLQHPESFIEMPTPHAEEVDPAVLGVLPTADSPPSVSPSLVSMLRASLKQVTEQKSRLVTGVRSPHEMLRLIRDVGVDLFDVGWAMNAAHIGVALDFEFPVSVNASDEKLEAPRRPLGHNLYDPVYARQFGRLADTFIGAGERAEGDTMIKRRRCSCIACSPHIPASHILHSAIDQQSYAATGTEATLLYGKPHSRTYIHHLLHTHEMSAHTLLVAHNLAIVSAFLADVRHLWMENEEENRSVRFALGVDRFSRAYDESGELFISAKKDWERVDKARGKGRLAKEREKEPEGDRNT